MNKNKNKSKRQKKENTLLLLQKKAELLKNIKEKFDILSKERKPEDEIIKEESIIQSRENILENEKLSKEKIEENIEKEKKLENYIEKEENVECKEDLNNNKKEELNVNDKPCEISEEKINKDEKIKENFDINQIKEKFKGKWVLESCKVGDEEYIDLFITAKFENKDITDKNFYEIYYFKEGKVKKYQYLEINYKEEEVEKKYINEIEIIAYYDITDEETIKIKIESGKKRTLINDEEKTSNISNIDKEILMKYKFEEDKLILYNTEDEEIRILGRYNADQSINS